MVIHNTVNISSYITYEFKNCNINSFFYIGKNSFFWLIVLIRKHPKEHTIFEIFAVHPFSSNAPDDWQEGLKICKIVHCSVTVCTGIARTPWARMMMIKIYLMLLRVVRRYSVDHTLPIDHTIKSYKKPHQKVNSRYLNLKISIWSNEKKCLLWY